MPPEVLLKCPHCQSQDIEPRGVSWICRTCNKEFPEAMVQVIEPPKMPKPPKKRVRK